MSASMDAALDIILADEPRHQPQLRPLLDLPGVLSEDWQSTSIAGAGGPSDEVTLSRATRSFLALTKTRQTSVMIRRKKALIQAYRHTRVDPYNPQSSIVRARILLDLGYGELAVADAYRGQLLLEALLTLDERTLEGLASDTADRSTLSYKVFWAAFTGHDKSLGMKGLSETGPIVAQRFKELERLSYHTMIKGLLSTRAVHDALAVGEQAIEQSPDDNQLVAKMNALRDSINAETAKQAIVGRAVMKSGHLNRVVYPWIATEEYGRSNKAIKKVKAAFERISDYAVLDTNPLCCGTEGGLGVFAKRQIRMGQRIVLDKSVYTTFNTIVDQRCDACTGPLKGVSLALECCKAQYCSPFCKDEATKAYHKTLCSKEFDWLYKAYRHLDSVDNGMVPLLMVKVLATAIQQNSKPLKVACVGALHAGYGKSCPSYFNLQDNVVMPIKILQTLGVDFFTDQRFDSWAIQTSFLRIENNKHGVELGKRTHGGLNPLFTMFNHDCDPAAMWQSVEYIGGPMEVRACRAIKEGEEICVSYTPVSYSEEERRDQVSKPHMHIHPFSASYPLTP